MHALLHQLPLIGIEEEGSFWFYRVDNKAVLGVSAASNDWPANNDKSFDVSFLVSTLI